MTKFKHAKSVVDAVRAQAQLVELRDVPVPADGRSKPALCLYPKLTTDQVRSLAEVLRSGNSSAVKAEVRKAPTIQKLCVKLEDHSEQRNKLSRGCILRRQCHSDGNNPFLARRQTR